MQYRHEWKHEISVFDVLCLRIAGGTINGGTVTLLNPSGRDADGIDSNGNIDINGGLVYISLVGDGSNCALDYGSENGGTVVACGGSDSSPPTPPDGDSDFRPSGEALARPDGKGATADRPSPSPGDSNAGAEPPALPDGSTAPSGQPTDSQDGQTPSADVRQIKEESFTLDENGKRLLMASVAALALGLVIAKAYRKKG